MKHWSRRLVLSGAAVLSAAPCHFKSGKAAADTCDVKDSAHNKESAPLRTGSSVALEGGKIARPFVHVTDLFRPHNDPDDHWDLATAYALVRSGNLDLCGVLTDDPANIDKLSAVRKELEAADGGSYKPRNPDVTAVVQLNYITDKAVPVATGTVWPNTPGERIHKENLPRELRGATMLLDMLRRSSKPVAILIGGSCQDVAIAGRKDPVLFRDKCAAIYLCAGIGSQNEKEQLIGDSAERNVRLNPGAYATIFELPSPVYWMPCFHGFDGNMPIVGEYGANWSFRQSELLPYLSNYLQAFFASVLSGAPGTNWLSYLLDSNSREAARKYFDEYRGMYSTAGFIHAAGMTVTSDGKLAPLDAASEDRVYEFMPIEVSCNDSGITE